MAYTIGYCGMCGGVFHDNGTNINIMEKSSKGIRQIKVFICPICKYEQEFIPIRDLCDW